MSIHPTAIVHPKAQIDPSAEVGPFAIIEAHVQIGARTTVGPHSLITGRTVIGEDNHFFNGCQIGVLSQDLKHAPELVGRTIIGNGNVFREFMTVSASTHASPADEEKITRIGDRCLFMAYSHVAHDCTVGSGVIMANCSALSGHVYVEDHVILGGLTGVHQFCRVGTRAFIGGMARINKDVLPFMIVEGHPAKCYGPNTVGLERAGYDAAARTRIKKMYKLLYRSGMNTSQALQAVESEVEDSPEKKIILDFIRNSERGLSK
ncbi:MAG: acyl-ACP--UDP-N-acetylglucosamine O-acyltransferase, partial [Candidatus Hydrogenedentes bacterium]|nr:acyl-ACP--UDP-N-acetylglucosamine O-acyltransferase [Candidatus Hydrogenedentota bacterium]